jgi:hypothetical protein
LQARPSAHPEKLPVRGRTTATGFLQNPARQHRNWGNRRPVPFRRRAERFAAQNLLGQKAWKAHREQTMNLLQVFLRPAHDGASDRVEPVPS